MGGILVVVTNEKQLGEGSQDVVQSILRNQYDFEPRRFKQPP